MDRRDFIKQGAIVAGAALALRSRHGEAAANNSDRRIERLVAWIRGSFHGGKVNLIGNLPSGTTRSGHKRDDLKNLYWLQNCNLFAAYALRPYDRTLADKLMTSYRHWYAEAFPDVREKTEHYLAVGQLPEHVPPDGMYFRMTAKVKQYEGFAIGTETYDPKVVGKINDEDPRTLLKSGALSCQLRGNSAEALQYFHKALALWDGKGFRNTRLGKHGAYYTRHIAYALLAERTLKTQIPDATRTAMERALWACQDDDGGIWTNYKPDGSIPGFAKKTTEIGPLALLAYGNAAQR